MIGEEHIIRFGNLFSIWPEIKRYACRAVVFSFIMAGAAMAVHISQTTLNREHRTAAFETTVRFYPVKPSESAVWMRIESHSGKAVAGRHSFSMMHPLRKSRSVSGLRPGVFCSCWRQRDIPCFPFQNILWAALPVRAGPSLC